LLAALAGLEVVSDLASDLRLLNDTVNFLRFRLTHVPKDQWMTEMKISQEVAHFLERFAEATTDDERGSNLDALPGVARQTLLDLRKLWAPA